MASSYRQQFCQCSDSTTFQTLSCAPCPPPNFGFEDFREFARTLQLSECEIETIASNCDFYTKNTPGASGLNVTGIIVGVSVSIFLVIIISVGLLVKFKVCQKNRVEGNKDEMNNEEKQKTIWSKVVSLVLGCSFFSKTSAVSPGPGDNGVVKAAVEQEGCSAYSTSSS